MRCFHHAAAEFIVVTALVGDQCHGRVACQSGRMCHPRRISDRIEFSGQSARIEGEWQADKWMGQAHAGILAVKYRDLESGLEAEFFDGLALILKDNFVIMKFVPEGDRDGQK